MFWHTVNYGSGTSIAQFPANGVLLRVNLKNQGQEVITGKTVDVADVAVLGLHQMQTPTELGGTETSGGRIVLYGDSNCLDNSHLKKGTGLEDIYYSIYTYS